MMNREEVKKAVMDLSAEDRFQLMLEIGPVLCKGIMERPGGRMQMMLRMMPVCREMMSRKMRAMASVINKKLSDMKRQYRRT